MAKKQENRIMQIDYMGKIPPQCVDIEENIIGVLLNFPDSIYSVYSIIKPIQFYKEEHQKITQAIFTLVDHNKQASLLLVQEQLRKENCLDEIGGPAYLTQLYSNDSTYGFSEHCYVLRSKFIQRELIRISSEIQNRAFDEDIDVNELEDYAQQEIFNLSSDNLENEAIRVDKIMNGEIEIINKLVSKEIEFTGIPSGFTKLDRLTGGWQKPDLILLAARPSMGKTAFMLHFAKNAALKKGIKVAIFSLEMSRSQLVRRIISYDCDINSMDMVKGRVTSNELNKMEKTLYKFENIPLYIDDTASISISSLNAKIRRYIMKYGIEIAFIDYLQLMTGEKGGNREQEISSISRGLKSCAKRNNIPIVALSQLNRSVEIRSNKRPQLSDLRESGAIEQDSDMVIFLHRPEKYGEQTFSTSNGEISTKEFIDLIIAKYRNGSIGDVFFWSNDSFTTLREDKDEQIISDDILPIEGEQLKF